MNKDNLIRLLKFTEFTNLFATIQRKTITNKDGTLENNSQHTFQMAILAWYICDRNNLDLSIEKLMKYSLVHDLVETYSGNFPTYSRNEQSQEVKNNAEALALDKLIPIINIELNNNDFYFRTKTTLQDMLKVKGAKIAKHKVVKKYFDLLQDYLTNDVKFFWPDCKNRNYTNKEYSFN